MTIRRQTGYVLLGFAVLAVLGIILGFIFAAAINSGSPPPPPPAAAPPPSTTSAPPQTTAPPSSPPSPVVKPLPEGVATDVPFPSGTDTNGFTSGNLDYPFEAPAYKVTVHTALVNKHWGFTYNFQCADPALDDAWRQAYPGRGSFSIQTPDGTYVVRGHAYNGSGIVTFQSSHGPAVHQLVVSGPCNYGLDYFYYPN